MTTKIQTIAVVGEGKMGANIFHYLREFDFRLYWLVSGDADLQKLQKNLDRKLKRALDAGLIDNAVFEAKQANSRITLDANELSPCDLIIEAIPEDRQTKQRLFEKLENILRPDAILTSNSSSINPSDLAFSASMVQRFAGLHFFYPVSIKNIVELIQPEGISAETVDSLLQFLEEIQRTPLLLDESCSFILNRIYLDFQNEAYLYMLRNQLTIELIDDVVKEHFCGAGVFEFCDQVGIDTMAESISNYTFNYTNRGIYIPLIQVLLDLVSANKLGVKTGEGFYSYLETSSTNANETGMLTESEKTELLNFLDSTLQQAVKTWSHRSGIPFPQLSLAMNEYLGMELNWEE